MSPGTDRAEEVHDPIGSASLDFDRDGAELFGGAALSILPQLQAMWPPNEPVPGTRLADATVLRRHLEADGTIGRIAGASGDLP